MCQQFGKFNFGLYQSNLTPNQKKVETKFYHNFKKWYIIQKLLVHYMNKELGEI